MSRPKVNFEKMIIIVKTWCVIMKYLPYMYLEVVDLKIFIKLAEVYALYVTNIY